MGDTKRYAILGMVTFVYMLASSAEVLLVKVLNYKLNVSLVILTALLLNAYWIIQLPLYLLMKRGSGRKLSRQQFIGYCTIGILAAAVTGTRAFGLNALPASVYVVVASADLVFNTILSRVFLKKHFTVYHYLAVAVAMGGISLVATDNTKSTKYKCDGDTCLDDYLPGILMATGSALASAINSVVADKLLKLDKKSILGVAEVSLFNSLIPCCVLWIPMVFTEEYTRYDDAWRKVKGEDMVAAFILVCVGLGISKMIDRATKFTMVLMKSAFFYAIVDSSRKVLTALFAIWVFGEANSWKKYAALGMTAVAMAIYAKGSLIAKRAKESAKASAAASTNTLPSLDLTAAAGQHQALLPRHDQLAMDMFGAQTAPPGREASATSVFSFYSYDEAIDELEDAMTGIGFSQSPSLLAVPTPWLNRRGGSAGRVGEGMVPPPLNLNDTLDAEAGRGEYRGEYRD